MTTDDRHYWEREDHEFVAVCDGCGRKTWDTTNIGRVCGAYRVEQFGNCDGIFQPVKETA